MGEIFTSRELFYFDWIYSFISAIFSLTILGNTLPAMNKLCSISRSRQPHQGRHSETNVPSEKGFSEDVKVRFVHSCGFRYFFNPFKGMFHPCYQTDVILCFSNHIPWWIWAPIQNLKKKKLLLKKNRKKQKERRKVLLKKNSQRVQPPYHFKFYQMVTWKCLPEQSTSFSEIIGGCHWWQKGPSLPTPLSLTHVKQMRDVTMSNPNGYAFIHF